MVVVSLTGQRTVPLPVDQIVVQDQELIGSLGSPGVWPEVLTLLATKSMTPSTLISHQFSLSDVGAAVELAKQRRPTTGKIVIRPNEVPLV